MMTSGLQANDGWEKNWAGVFEMMKSNDWTQYALNLPMEAAPGNDLNIIPAILISFQQ